MYPRFGKSVAGAYNRASKYYNGHISYRDHRNQEHQAAIRVEIEDVVPPPQLPGKKKTYEAKPEARWNKKSDDIDWLKQSGKYAKKIEPMEDGDQNTLQNIQWQKASGKYNAKIEPTEMILPPKSPPHVFPKPFGKKSKQKVVTPKGTIDYKPKTNTYPKPNPFPQPDPYRQDSGSYDDVMPARNPYPVHQNQYPIHQNQHPGNPNPNQNPAYQQESTIYDDAMSPGHRNPAFLPDAAHQRGNSDSSDEYYSRARDTDVARVLSVSSDVSYQDAMSPQISPRSQQGFNPGNSPRYQGYSAQVTAI